MIADPKHLTGTDPPPAANPTDAMPVVARAALSWQARWATLAPVIGCAGVAAIYLSALERAGAHYPWLDEVIQQTYRSDPFTPLLARLSTPPDETVTAVQASVLDAFDRQLRSLIGGPLAERLLAMVRAREAGADSPLAPSHDEIAGQLIRTALRAEHDARVARRERDRALHAGRQDELTGAASRSSMIDRLKSAIALADRTGTPTAVLFIDLDHFKQINDGLGHQAGDDMLREVSMQVQAAVRKTDTVCRYGGDEFVVILTPMERRSEAAPAAGRIRRAIAQVRTPAAAVPTLSASIGIGLYPEHGTSPDALLSRADRSMYRHKSKCRQETTPIPVSSGRT
jgi:diguanylate cyclase (GGDEF)-like protein